MKAGLWLDVLAFAYLFLLPLPGTLRTGGAGGLFLWLCAWALIFVLLTGLGCSRCPFVFCPIGRAGRGLRNLAGRNRDGR